MVVERKLGGPSDGCALNEIVVGIIDTFDGTCELHTIVGVVDGDVVGSGLGGDVVAVVGFGDGYVDVDGELVTGVAVGTELLLTAAPYPVGLRQLGAAGCTHWLLLHTAPGSQHLDGEVHGLP